MAKKTVSKKKARTTRAPRKAVLRKSPRTQVKKVVSKKKVVKKPVKKVVKQPVKKPAKKVVVKKPVKLSKAELAQEQKAEGLLTMGRTRGFVTYDEILKEFPAVE